MQLHTPQDVLDVKYMCPDCKQRDKSNRFAEILDELIRNDTFNMFLYPVTGT
jgi:hypothetical protein